MLQFLLQCVSWSFFKSESVESMLKDLMHFEYIYRGLNLFYLIKQAGHKHSMLFQLIHATFACLGNEIR